MRGKKVVLRSDDIPAASEAEARSSARGRRTTGAVENLNDSGGPCGTATDPLWHKGATAAKAPTISTLERMSATGRRRPSPRGREEDLAAVRTEASVALGVSEMNERRSEKRHAVISDGNRRAEGDNATESKTDARRRRNSIEIWWDGLSRKRDAGTKENEPSPGVDSSDMDGVKNWWRATTAGRRPRDNDDSDRKGDDVLGGKRGTSGNEACLMGIQNKFSSFLIPTDLRCAIDILNETLRECENHGIVDVTKIYPFRQVAQAVYVLAKLQKVSSLVQKVLTKEGRAAPPGPEPSDDLLSEFARYSSFASAAYGWKLQLVTSGKLHPGGDVSALLAKTGVQERDVVAVRWEAEPHRPAFFLLRDHAKRSVVLCIRGTVTMKDILTDLFFHEDRALRDLSDYDVFVSKMGQGQIASMDAIKSQINVCAHEGMVSSAREIAKEVRLAIEAEMTSHEGYRLVLCGHSMGGGAAAILGSFWSTVFPNVVVYVYGCPCVSPLYSKPARADNIYSIVREGDPFSTLSLGHVADISKAIAQLCEDDELRMSALRRVQNQNAKDISSENQDWCYQTLSKIREGFDAEKFYPSGQVYCILGEELNTAHLRLVEPEKFGEMALHKNMTNLTRHYFSNYESYLVKLWAKKKKNLQQTVSEL